MLIDINGEVIDTISIVRIKRIMGSSYEGFYFFIHFYGGDNLMVTERVKKVLEVRRQELINVCNTYETEIKKI
jgi:hypothetical protein